MRSQSPVKSWSARLSGAFSAVVGAVSGVAPHVLHHVGPLAGTALVSGAFGSVLFGAVGFALTVPLLIKLKRRFGTWAAPSIALAIFVVIFTISTLWIGPLIREELEPTEVPQDPHHPEASGHE